MNGQGRWSVVTRVLLVEDDESIGRALAAALTGARYEVRWCRDGASAIEAADPASGFGLVVLDLGLPDVDGVDVCRAVRARVPAAVIVMLTARDAEIDVVVGLEAGADDYLTKPIRATELLARLRAHLRRAGTAGGGVSEGSGGGAPAVWQVGALRVDETTRRVWFGSSELMLRARQFELLARLAREPGTAVSRETLMADVWDENWFGSTKTLDVHVAALRRALAEAQSAAGTDTLSDVALPAGADPGAGARPAPAARSRAAPEIVTLRGFGYRLQPADGGQQGSVGHVQSAAGDDD